MLHSKFAGAFLFVAVVAVLPGCMNGARIVGKTSPTSGVVAIPANTNVWPTYYRDQAVQAIREKHGMTAEIVWGKEEEVVVGKETRSDDVSDRRVRGDENKPSGEIVRNTSVTTTTDKKEYHIEYHVRMPAPMNGGIIQAGAFGNGNPTTTTNQSGRPAGRTGLNNPNPVKELEPAPSGFGGSSLNNR